MKLAEHWSPSAAVYVEHVAELVVLEPMLGVGTPVPDPTNTIAGSAPLVGAVGVVLGVRDGDLLGTGVPGGAHTHTYGSTLPHKNAPLSSQCPPVDCVCPPPSNTSALVPLVHCAHEFDVAPPVVVMPV